MDNYVDTWGYYIRYTDPDSIHPHDVEIYQSIYVAHEIVFHCVDQVHDYLVLAFGDKQFRIKPDHYQMMSQSPTYNCEDLVEDPNHPSKVGIITRIGWHGKLSKHFYYINLDGKKKSKRYFEEDLIRLPNSR